MEYYSYDYEPCLQNLPGNKLLSSQNFEDVGIKTGENSHLIKKKCLNQNIIILQSLMK